MSLITDYHDPVACIACDWTGFRGLCRKVEDADEYVCPKCGEPVEEIFDEEFD